MNTIIIEFCAEDRERLDRLTAALENANPLEKASAAMKHLAETVQAAAEPAPAPVKEEEPAPAPVPEPVKEEPPKPAHTLADVQALVQTMLVPGSNKRAEVKALIKSYAERVSAIPADKIDEVWKKLAEMKGAQA